MNAWSKMNDPREAKDWKSTGTLKAAGGYTQADMDKRLNDVLRRSARLLALTADREPSPGAEPASLFHRGWGRAPLWAHYADDHRGVCLVLDPAAVNEALDGLPPKADRLRFWGGIEYLDKPIRIPLTATVTDQASLDQAIKNYITSKGQYGGLYMIKNTDWAYETELRIAVVEFDLDEHELDSPVYIPLGDCLKAVIFGDAHPAPRLITAGIDNALGGDSPEFFQCHWTHGAPSLELITI